jgi:hypothetical protein
MSVSKRYFSVISLLAILVISGCASTGGSYKLVTPPINNTQVTKFSDLIVEVECKQGIPLTSVDKERILNLVIKNIRSENAIRFHAINSTTPSHSTLHASVVIKRYDKGNAFARFFLAGLGQMHIDADVALADWSTKEKIAQYEVTKTFAWGGAYGSAVSIQDIEEGFSKAVASSILGK